MGHESTSGNAFYFGPFRFEVAPYGLFRKDEAVEITPQQAQLLEVLLLEKGQVVSREAIRERLWPAGIHVDFDRGINYCVARLRAALGDRSGAPLFIETVPRRGYRFIASVSSTPESAESSSLRDETLAGPASSGMRIDRRVEAEQTRGGGLVPWMSGALGAVAVLLLGGAAISGFGLPGLGLGDAGRPSDPLRLEGAVEGVASAAACESLGVGEGLAPKAQAALHRGGLFAARRGNENRISAIEALTEVLAYHPDFEPAVACQARLHHRHREWKQALPLAMRALEIEPTRADSLLIMADADFRLHFDWPRAEERFRAALDLYPRHEELRVGYASLLSALGRPREATEWARQTFALWPLSLRARAELAEELYLAGHLQESLPFVQRALSVDAQDVDAFYGALHIYLAMGQEAAAVALANRWLSQFGWGPASVESIEAFFALLVERHAESVKANQNLSEMAYWTLQAGRTEEARRLMERACAERSGWSLPYFDVDPRFRPFHEFPGLESLEACLHGSFDLGEKLAGE